MSLSGSSCQVVSLLGAPGLAKNRRWQHRAVMSSGGGGGCGPCAVTGLVGSNMGMVTACSLH